MKNTKKYQIANIVGFIGVITANFLANYLPLNGYNTGELSDMYPNLFVPAGLTFSIWGVIYLFLLGFIIYQSKGLINKLNKTPNFIPKIGWLFFISSLANIGWIFAWHHLMVFLSLIFMIILLISLIGIYLRLNIGRNNFTKAKKIFVNIPFSLYLGWITIATIANVTAWLVSINWSGWGLSEVTWTIIILIVGIIITILNTLNRADSIYALVVIWAYLGIILKRYQAEPRYVSIILTAAIGILIIFFTIFYAKKKKKKRKKINF
ncbi:MAG: hypothetical protein ACQEQD_01695 [Bacillota bacterium]